MLKRHIVKVSCRRCIILFKVKACFLQHRNQCVIIQKAYDSLGMDTHVIPGRRQMWIGIPGSTYIRMLAGENHEDVWIVQKGKVVVIILHDMPPQYFHSILFFNKYRYLGGYRFIICITTSQKSKRILVNKFLNDLFILLFVVREVVHRNKFTARYYLI